VRFGKDWKKNLAWESPRKEGIGGETHARIRKGGKRAVLQDLFQGAASGMGGEGQIVSLLKTRFTEADKRNKTMKGGCFQDGQKGTQGAWTGGE